VAESPYPSGEACLALQRVDELPRSTWPGSGVPQQLHLDLVVDDLEELNAVHCGLSHSVARRNWTARTTLKSLFAFTSIPMGIHSASLLSQRAELARVGGPTRQVCNPALAV